MSGSAAAEPGSGGPESGGLVPGDPGSGDPSSGGPDSEPPPGAEPLAPARFTHLDSAGAARMVDVADKPVSARTAVATGRVLVSAQVLALLRGAGMPKGDALAVARIAGIQGAKRTSELIPLCHPIGIAGVTVDLDLGETAVLIRAQVKTTDRTGVEMEALTAVAVAGLTLIDMVKAVDPAAVITDVQVESKSGGMSGDWTR